MTWAHFFQPHSLAPWAEIVPGHGFVQVDTLLSMPDDGFVYEVVEGVLVGGAGSGNRVTRISLRLGGRLGAYVDEHGLGVATGADGVYKFPGAETGLIPDVGYSIAERVSLVTEEDKPIPFPPDLAAEVVAPSQDSDDMAAKARLYLRAGTRLLWIVWPQSGHIDVWRAGVLTGPVTTLRKSDTLDGENVILGFSSAVSDLLADQFRDGKGG